MARSSTHRSKHGEEASSDNSDQEKPQGKLRKSDDDLSKFLSYSGKQQICSICSDPASENGSNWSQKERDSRGKFRPVGPICKCCGEFVDYSPFSIAELVTMAKSRKVSKQVADNRAEFHEHKSHPESVPWAKREVWKEDYYDSMVIQDHDLVTRTDFFDKEEMYPDDVGLHQGRWQDGQRRDLLAIPVARPETKCEHCGCGGGPVLRTFSGTRTVLRSPMLDGDKNLYQNAGQDFFEQGAKSTRALFGGSWANKYLPKNPTLTVYTQEDIEKAVQTRKKKIGEKPRPSPSPSPTKPRAGDSEVTLCLTNGPAEDCDDGAPSDSGNEGRAVEDFSDGRNKSPAYWKAVLVPESIFGGRNLSKQMGFAKKCVERTSKINSLEAGKLQKVVERAQLCIDLTTALHEEKDWSDVIYIVTKIVEKKIEIPDFIEDQLHTARLMYNIRRAITTWHQTVDVKACTTIVLIVAAYDPFLKGEKASVNSAKQRENSVLGDFESDPQKRYTKAAETFLQKVVKTLVDYGDDCAEVLLKISEDTIDMVQRGIRALSILDEDEEADVSSSLTSMIQAAKVVITAHAPGHVMADFSAVTKCQLEFDASSDTFLSELCIIFKGAKNKYFASSMQNLLTNRHVYEEAYAEWAEAMAESQSMLDDASYEKSCVTAQIMRFVDLQKKIRTADAFKLENLVTKVVHAFCATIKASITEDPKTAGMFKDFVDVLKQHLAVEGASFVSWFEGVEAESSSVVTLEDYRRALKRSSEVAFSQDVLEDIKKSSKKIKPEQVDAEAKATLLQLGRARFKFALTQLPGKPSNIDEILEIADLMGSSTDGHGQLVKLTLTLPKIADMMSSAQAVQALDGSTISDKLKANPQICETFLRNWLTFSKHLEKEKIEISAEAFGEAVDKGKVEAFNLCNEMQACEIDGLTVQANAVIDGIKDSMRGGEDGAVWSSSIKGTHRLPSIVKTANATLLKVNADALKNAYEELAKLGDQATDLKSRYMIADVPIAKQIKEVEENCRLTYAEILILGLHQGTRSPEEKRDKARSIQKKVLGKVTNGYDLLLPQLKVRCDEFLAKQG